jgi:hypothetical protein
MGERGKKKNRKMRGEASFVVQTPKEGEEKLRPFSLSPSSFSPLFKR